MARTTIRTEDITAGEVTTAKMATDPTNASNLASGTVGSARMGSGSASSSTILYGDGTWKAEPVTDTGGLEDDIALLGFKVAANGSLAKYNLADQVIDDFQDGSGINKSSSTNEYVETTYVVGSSAHDGHGGTITYEGSNTVHTFLSSTTFTNATGVTSLEYLVVAGGGAGGDGYAGGGGAGGYRVDTGFTVTADTEYAITVGAGGIGRVGRDSSADGGDSVFSTITSTGGGQGATPGGGTTGSDGGSGGGGHDNGNGGAASPVTSPVQGYSGGNSGYNVAGGGGGAGASGTAGVYNTYSGDGGVGEQNNITGLNLFYAGGGGGGGDGTSRPVGDGGMGGGGNGGRNDIQSTAGTDGLGGGGGGGFPNATDGGSGVVIISYPTVTQTEADLTLVSTTNTATDAVTKGDIVMTYTNGAGTATLNTDLKVFVSRDNGANYTEGTLVAEGTTSGHSIASFHDLTLGGSDTSQMVYKITTHNQSAAKETRIQAVSLGWS